jgi:adenine-specific DNA-methyltransferase
MLQISNRRYIGSKKSLALNIFEVVEKHIKLDTYTVSDLFAGTAAVSDFFLEKGKDVIINDSLYSNYLTYCAWFGNEEIDLVRLEGYVDGFNRIDPASLESNYFSDVYGGKYYSKFAAMKIGAIRDEIDQLPLNARERAMLISSLMYSADKIANTVGHFEHYLSGDPSINDLKLELPHIKARTARALIFQKDANKLVREIKSDVVYIDPPYNSRQYINFYHVLENLALWQKPTEFQGTSMKFMRDHLKSDYSKSKAPKVFEDLIQNVDAKLIVVSYNNTYSAKSTASNNKISEEEIERILRQKGELVEKLEMPHKFFNSGKTSFDKHVEYLYVCKVP